MSFLSVYKYLTIIATPLIKAGLLQTRLRAGKEDPTRVKERYGQASQPRPNGPLIWLHAASVGEAQSALITVSRLLAWRDNLHILVTTGTVTSASLMATQLPDRAIHQYCPLDQPQWVAAFLNHWQPNYVLWMESELWPNMLLALKERTINAALLNARLSERSRKRWSLIKNSARAVLSTFQLILTQTPNDALAFQTLSESNIQVSGNLKYSAAPLSFNNSTFNALKAAIDNRPMWVYASTHAGEEALACSVHQQLKTSIPNLLTIIVPRHPARREEIHTLCNSYTNLNTIFRDKNHTLPTHDTDIYIANTLGELVLFYRLAPLAMIGRSLSDDGGGGHNPIEAAQLGAAILSGPHVQYQKEIFDDMAAAQAVSIVNNADDLTHTLATYFQNPTRLNDLQKNGKAFVESKAQVIEKIEKHLLPLIEQALS